MGPPLVTSNNGNGPPPPHADAKRRSVNSSMVGKAPPKPPVFDTAEAKKPPALKPSVQMVPPPAPAAAKIPTFPPSLLPFVKSAKFGTPRQGVIHKINAAGFNGDMAIDFVMFKAEKGPKPKEGLNPEWKTPLPKRKNLKRNRKKQNKIRVSVPVGPPPAPAAPKKPSGKVSPAPKRNPMSKGLLDSIKKGKTLKKNKTAS